MRYTFFMIILCSCHIPLVGSCFTQENRTIAQALKETSLAIQTTKYNGQSDKKTIMYPILNVVLSYVIDPWQIIETHNNVSSISPRSEPAYINHRESKRTDRLVIMYYDTGFLGGPIDRTISIPPEYYFDKQQIIELEALQKILPSQYSLFSQCGEAQLMIKCRNHDDTWFTLTLLQQSHDCASPEKATDTYNQLLTCPTLSYYSKQTINTIRTKIKWWSYDC